MLLHSCNGIQVQVPTKRKIKSFCLTRISLHSPLLLLRQIKVLKEKNIKNCCLPLNVEIATLEGYWLLLWGKCLVSWHSFYQWGHRHRSHRFHHQNLHWHYWHHLQKKQKKDVKNNSLSQIIILIFIFMGKFFSKAC